MNKNHFVRSPRIQTFPFERKTTFFIFFCWWQKCYQLKPILAARLWLYKEKSACHWTIITRRQFPDSTALKWRFVDFRFRPNYKLVSSINASVLRLIVVWFLTYDHLPLIISRWSSVQNSRIMWYPFTDSNSGFKKDTTVREGPMFINYAAHVSDPLPDAITRTQGLVVPRL